MSVINQMLRDLDARQASKQERAGLPPQLRTLPPAHTRRFGSWGLLFVGLAAGAAIAWLLVGQAPAPAPVVAPAASSAPVIMPTPPAVAVAEPPVAVLPAPTIAAPPAPVVSRPPPPKPAAEAVVKPAAKPAEKPTVAAVIPPAQPLAAAAGETRIEKQPKGGQTREQAEAEYRKGVQAASQGDHAAALPALRRALELDPQHAKARQALLSVLASNRQWDEVRQVAQSGLALDPTRSGWASILARLQHEQGDTAAAVETLERHAVHATGDVDYQGLFAFLLQKRQRPAEATQRYQAALALRPGEGRWWFGLGLALEAAGRGDEARTAFGRAKETGNLSADMLGVVEQKLR
ncbi:MAG: tetratricopeptide repeat protein [Rhodocyclaceae bacterium]|nr:tetratricopeptide repeat protein [Rhodocyclaceae bacterium]